MQITQTWILRFVLVAGLVVAWGFAMFGRKDAKEKELMVQRAMENGKYRLMLVGTWKDADRPWTLSYFADGKLHEEGLVHKTEPLQDMPAVVTYDGRGRVEGRWEVHKDQLTVIYSKVDSTAENITLSYPEYGRELGAEALKELEKTVASSLSERKGASSVRETHRSTIVKMDKTHCVTKEQDGTLHSMYRTSPLFKTLD